MRFEKVLVRLKELDTPTRKRFRKYLHSPYFNVPYQAKELYEYLLTIHWSFSAKSLSKEAIAHSHPKLKSTSQQDKGGTYLLKSLIDFLAYENMISDKASTNISKLQALKNKHWFDLFELKYSEAVEYHSKQSNASLEHFEIMHKLTELKHNGFAARLNHSLSNDIEPVVKSLDLYYAVKKMRYLCEKVNRKRVLGINYDEKEGEPLIALLEQNIYSQNSYVSLFTNAFRMLKAKSYEESIIYSAVIKNHVQKRSRQHIDQSIKEVVKYTRIHCVHWSNRGIKPAGKEYLWWAHYELKNNLLTDKKLISPVTFINIISAAAQTDNPTQSIRTWKNKLAHYLPVEKKKSHIDFADGVIAFASSDFAEAFGKFKEAEAKNQVVFNCILRRWQIISSFENAPYNIGLSALLAAFNQYIKRSEELPAHHKESLSLFTSYCGKMLQTPLKNRQEILLGQIQAEDFFPGKDWMIQKLEPASRKKRGNV